MIEITTGETHGTFDCEADVALCLVFEKLARHQVDVLCNASPLSSYTAWHSPGASAAEPLTPGRRP